MRRSARLVGTKARHVFGHATSRARLLPSFLVIGAARSGTTTLFYYLSQHPDVARPATKEIHFFDHNYWRGVDWYRGFFATSVGDRVAGEATPYYLFHPAVPERVAATLPDVRLIAILRNPVDRAFSHYRKMRRHGKEPLSFRKALDAEAARTAGEQERLLADARYRSRELHRHAYVARGLYADQLERWLTHFEREQLLVLRAEDFFARPREVYAQTLTFIGLDPFDPGELRARNPRPQKPLRPGLRARLEKRFSEPNERLAQLLGTDVWWGPAAGQSVSEVDPTIGGGSGSSGAGESSRPSSSA
ncbi:MAG: sulfotransferase domain-containing protein [Gaiellaceae bacterium]